MVLTDARNIAALADHLCDVIEVASQSGMTRFDTCSSIVIREIEALAHEPIGRKNLLAVGALKLAVASSVACEWNAIGNPERAWYWVAVALGKPDATGTQMTVIPEIIEMLTRSPISAPIAVPALLNVTAPLYYLASSRGYHRETAAALYAILAPLCKQMIDYGESAVTAAVQLISWQTINGHVNEAKELIEILEKKLLNRSNDQSAMLIATFLTTGIAIHSSRSAAEHADWALANLRDIPPIARITLLAAYAPQGANSVLQRFHEICDTVDQILEEIANAQPDRLDRSYSLTQAFNVLSPIVHALCKGGHIKEAHLLLAKWKCVPAANVRVSESAILIPDGTGTHVALPDMPMVNLSNAPSSNLAHATNLTLGMAIADQTDQNFTLNSPPTNHIDHAHAQSFHDAVHEYIRPDLLANALSTPRRVDSIISFLPPHVPVQALLAREGGPVLPISASYAEPLEDRYPNRIQFWCGDLYLAQAELEVVKHVFQWVGEVDVVQEGDLSREAFLDSYSSDTYDVIWVAAHGQHPRYRPTESAIHLSDTVTISLRDLAARRNNADERRRLLVLNTCDSAAAATYGSFSELGIAHFLTSSNQAVIANLWSVSTYSACIFGGLLAAGLSGGQSYFDSFAWALETLARDRRDIAEAVSEFDMPSPFMDVIHEYTDPSVLQWGAPAFYE